MAELRGIEHYLGLYHRKLNRHFIDGGRVNTDEAKLEAHAYALGQIVRAAQVDAVVHAAKELVRHQMNVPATMLLQHELTEDEIVPYVDEAMAELQDKLVRDISRDLPNDD